MHIRIYADATSTFMTKVSLVIPILNECNTISNTLNALYGKEYLLEIIIVDGGSTDGTLEVLNSFKKKHPELSIRIFRVGGNISVARNYGTKKSKSDICVYTDSGCIARKDWLKKIIAPFSDNHVQVVAGFYEMVGESLLQKAVMPFLGVTKTKYKKDTFLPSARSLALRKSAWRAVGGFPENLTFAGEDTLFNFNLVKAGLHIYREKRAIVTWEAPNSLKYIAKKFFFYAKGDAEANIWWHPVQKFKTHNIKILTIFARYIVFFVLLGSFGIFGILPVLLYVMWSVLKVKSQIAAKKALLLVPLIQILSDICVMAGFSVGLLGVVKNKAIITLK